MSEPIQVDTNANNNKFKHDNNHNNNNKNSTNLIDDKNNPFKQMTLNAKELNTKLMTEKNEVKKQMNQAMNEAESRLSMEGQLKTANESLKKFLNPSLKIEEKIPISLLKDAKGIIFLSIIKGGMLVGGSTGTGVMFAKSDNNQWSGPCSIGLIGAQIGLNVGIQLTDFIFILRDNNALNTIMENKQIKFGLDVSISAGPLGRDANIGLAVNSAKYYAPIMSYSLSKGLYIGIAFEGQGIEIRDDCNKKFYGISITAKDILSGNITKNEIPLNPDYKEICQMLNNYIKEMQLNKEQIKQLNQK